MIKITQPSVLIQISRSWHYGIFDGELYEVTRGVGKIGEHRTQVELAPALVKDMGHKVSEVDAFPCSTWETTVEFKAPLTRQDQVEGYWVAWAVFTNIHVAKREYLS